MVNVGGVMSSTVMVKIHCATFPASSTIAQITVVTPENRVPEVSLQMTSTFMSQLSARGDNEKSTTAEQPSRGVIIVSAGQVKLGAVTSRTTTSNEQVVLLPDKSVAV